MYSTNCRANIVQGMMQHHTSRTAFTTPSFSGLFVICTASTLVSSVHQHCPQPLLFQCNLKPRIRPPLRDMHQIPVPPHCTTKVSNTRPESRSVQPPLGSRWPASRTSVLRRHFLAVLLWGQMVHTASYRHNGVGVVPWQPRMARKLSKKSASLVQMRCWGKRQNS